MEKYFALYFQGRQPTVSLPPFYPDQAKPFLAQAEAEKLFAKLDRIFLETGCPPFPLLLAAFPVIIIWAIVNFSATTWYIQIFCSSSHI